MKYIFCLFSMFFFTKECNDATPETETMKSAQDDISITYEASTRGFYEKIAVSKEHISVAKDRNGNNTITKECSAADWADIIKILDKVDAEKIKTNPATDEDIARDAAIPATLTVKYKDNTVTSNTFGHGNPPETLTALLAKIHAMAKAVDKP